MPRFQLEKDRPVILFFASSHSESPVKCEPAQPGQGNQSFRLALCIVRLCGNSHSRAYGHSLAWWVRTSEPGHSETWADPQTSWIHPFKITHYYGACLLFLDTHGHKDNQGRFWCPRWWDAHFWLSCSLTDLKAGSKPALGSLSPCQRQ